MEASLEKLSLIVREAAYKVVVRESLKITTARRGKLKRLLLI
jgi:hypothetical protein